MRGRPSSERVTLEGYLAQSHDLHLGQALLRRTAKLGVAFFAVTGAHAAGACGGSRPSSTASGPTRPSRTATAAACARARKWAELRRLLQVSGRLAPSRTGDAAETARAAQNDELAVDAAESGWDD